MFPFIAFHYQLSPHFLIVWAHITRHHATDAHYYYYRAPLLLFGRHYTFAIFFRLSPYACRRFDAHAPRHQPRPHNSLIITPLFHTADAYITISLHMFAWFSLSLLSISYFFHFHITIRPFQRASRYIGYWASIIFIATLPLFIFITIASLFSFH